MKRALILTTLASALTACASDAEPIITTCESIGSARPLCGWQNPEDMAALPGGRYVLVSEYGGMNGERAGALALLDLETDDRRIVYDGHGEADEESWGARDCPGQPGGAFSPHGIHLSERDDGRLQLFAVQHGGRESVEMFEVRSRGGAPSLVWRGCAVAPDRSTLNDVAGLPDGSFFVTHMMPRRGMAGQMISFALGRIFGMATGHVLVWRPGKGFTRQLGTEGPIPNGIELSPDGTKLFVNYSARGEVRRIDHRTGTVERSVMLRPLDNATWAPDGRLLVAAAIADAVDMMRCTDLEQGQCPGAFAILAVDPQTLEAEEIYRGGPGTPSGAGTAGLLLPDGTLLIGTFAGDRILRVALLDTPQVLSTVPSHGRGVVPRAELPRFPGACADGVGCHH